MYLFLDTETTGINKASDRVIQIAWVLTNKFGEIIKETEYIIRPDGFYIPSRATAIHGISTEFAKKNGLNLNKVLGELSDISQKANYVIAHNIQFDLNFLKKEFELEKIKYPFDSNLQICTMQSAVTHCRLAKLNGMPGFKRPTLQELHFKLFKKYFDKAHDALADTQACMKCFFELKRLGNYPNISELEGSLGSSQYSENNKHRQNNPESSQIHTSNKNVNSNDSSIKNEILRKLKAELEAAKDRITSLEKEIESYNSKEPIFSKESSNSVIELRKALARSPNTPVLALIEICMSLDYEYDEILAIILIQNESLPSKYIGFLINEVNEDLSIYASKNPSCTADLLAQIEWSELVPSEIVKQNKSYSPLALESYLNKLTTNNNDYIRSEVAEYCQFPHILNTLSFDKNVSVRINVAKNISSNKEILLRLLNDEDEYVRHHAIRNENHPERKAETD